MGDSNEELELLEWLEILEEVEFQENLTDSPTPAPTPPLGGPLEPSEGDDFPLEELRIIAIVFGSLIALVLLITAYTLKLQHDRDIPDEGDVDYGDFPDDESVAPGVEHPRKKRRRHMQQAEAQSKIYRGRVAAIQLEGELTAKPSDSVRSLRESMISEALTHRDRFSTISGDMEDKVISMPNKDAFLMSYLRDVRHRRNQKVEELPIRSRTQDEGSISNEAIGNASGDLDLEEGETENGSQEYEAV